MSDRTAPDFLTLHLRELPAFRALLRGIECRLFRQAGELAGPVLDLGCGDGHFAALALRQPPDLGIDPERRKLREARVRQSHRLLVCARGEALPCADASFATLVANCVLEHWEYYMSAAALRAFDLAHYLGVPRLISYKLSGRWVALRIPGVNRLYDAWLRPHYEAGPPEIGAYIFFHARKAGGGERPG